MSKMVNKIIGHDFCLRCAQGGAAMRSMPYRGIINSHKCHNLYSGSYWSEREIVIGQDLGLEDFHRGAS